MSSAMDSVTHIVLGAAVGEILAGKKVGKRAMIVGAAAQSLPDIDFVAGLWLPPAQYFFAHRGITHSLVFVLGMSLFLSWAINHFHKLRTTFLYWFIFFFAQLLIHILLDSLNAYGVGWFEPFSHQRISFDVLFVADPFFSVSLAVACIVLFFLSSVSTARIKWATASVVISLSYIVYAEVNKLNVAKGVAQSLDEQKIVATNTLITPTPLNVWLWYVVAEKQGGYLIGFHSVFDRTPLLKYQFFPKNDSLLRGIRNHDETQSLIQLARDFYVVEKRHDTLTFSNLRFGQINGWSDPGAKFIFRYNLEKAGNSLFTVQHGRFSGWNRKTWADFLNRIKGN